MDGTFDDEMPMTTLPQDEGNAPDPRAILMERVANLAGQIFCARAGEVINKHIYGATDAVRDASYLLTVALNPGEVESHLAQAAEKLKLPTIWPPAPAEDPVEEGPF